MPQMHASSSGYGHSQPSSRVWQRERGGLSSMFQNVAETLQRCGVERQTFSIGWR